eukprot:4212989-Pyramimonas_sp.AAC.1
MQNDKELSAEPPVAVRVSYHMKEAAACGEGIWDFYRTRIDAALSRGCTGATSRGPREVCLRPGMCMQV